MHRLFQILLMALSFVSCKKAKNLNQLSSAQPNVVVLEREFKMLNLDRTRKIRIFLPDNYWESEQKYPVIYMHDAQSLFDNATASGEEWSIDESLNKLSSTSKFDLIVVGIDNGDKRLGELTPWKNKKLAKPEGKEYMAFIVNQIKPYIDSTYRTLPNRENTAIMGSSLGALISHYAIFEYPNVFSKAGILSPSYWYSDKIYSFTKNNPLPKDARLYIYGGKKEPTNVVINNKKVYNIILESGHSKENTVLIVNPDGGHNVAAWKKQFIPAIKWLFEVN